MQVTLANLGTKSGQNTLIYQVTDDGQVKNTDAVRTGSDAMQFAAKSLCTYVVLTYTTVSDVNGNDITTLYHYTRRWLLQHRHSLRAKKMAMFR